MFTKETEIFNINCGSDFQNLAIDVFQYQYTNNSVYNAWVNQFVKNPESIKSIYEIPFLPIEFFKTNKVICGDENKTEEIFTSSSTTSQTPSKHYVSDLNLYKKSFTTCFQEFFGPIEDYCFLALLPGYLDRKGSSLVYMCNELIKESKHPLSGFYLRNLDEMEEVINQLKQKKQKTIIIGVSYALLDLAERNILLNDNFYVIETGGMKGTRKEMLKQELHQFLKNKFGIQKICSEYGMTELLSQSYSLGDEAFKEPNWMKFLIRDVNDPLSYLPHGKTGGINIIDLANVNSCSFIATKDLGFINENGDLQLMGRYDNSDIRGCNLMVV